MTDLSEARLNASAARGRLKATADYARQRLRPAALLADGRDVAKEHAIALATTALSSRKSRILVALSAVVAGTGYLMRKPIARYFLKQVSKEKKND